MQKMPVIGEHFHKEIPESDNVRLDILPNTEGV